MSLLTGAIFKYGNICIKNISQRVISRNFKTSCCKYLFFERDPKSGYGNEELKKVKKHQLVREGLKELKHEIKLWREEIEEKFEADPILLYTPGIVDKQWELKSQKDLENWVVTCDSDNGEGFSSCQLTLSPQSCGLFSGVLDLRVPKDGKMKRAGYCSIRTKRARKSFKRDSYLNWSNYTHLVIRLRGDGRSYLLNISTCGYFDQLWNDVYHYVLFTRGGPYWQVAKIPFSKFFFSSKGRIQDRQIRVPLDKVSHFGITAADKINGPFSLEIDYVGLEYDPSHTEEFAYEMYRTSKNIAAN